MRVIEGPDPDLIHKLNAQNPQWTIDEWERWWCKWGKTRWPNWAQLNKCTDCKCERAKCPTS